MTRYYCSGFDVENAFGHGMGERFRAELKGTGSVVYIPGGYEKVEKVKAKQAAAFDEYFRKAGIEFERSVVITPEMAREEAQKWVIEADLILLMGGNPFSQKELCEKLGILDLLGQTDAILMGFSAGAMLMSRYIIITPCSETFPEFRIEKGLDLDGISIYPHNNTDSEEYPEELTVDGEITRREDLIRVAREYGDFYLLQDFQTEAGVYDVSYIRCENGQTEFCREHDGRIWTVDGDGVRLYNF